MRKIFYTTALALAIPLTVVSGASAETFNANFNNGSIPSGIVVSEGDSHALHEKCYRGVMNYDPWVVLNLGTNGFAAVSLTHSDAGLKHENRMTLPPLKIEGDDYVISWRAISYHPDFTDSYKVILSTDNDKEDWTLFGTDAESGSWVTHAVSLKNFDGQTVTITFVCDSDNGYMLAVDDLFVGPAEKVAVFAEDTTRKFVGDVETAPITGYFLNVGKELYSARLLLLDETGTEVDEKKLDDIISPGVPVEFKLQLPVQLNQKSEYTVALEAAGEKKELFKDVVFSSFYARNHVVEKCTGMWCTNCPEGNIFLDGFTKTYGDQGIVMENHVSSNGVGDILANDAYWANLKFYAVPYFMLNRVRDTAYSNLGKFDAGLYKETPAAIAVTSINELGDERGAVSGEVEFAKEFDNSNDRYRVAYSLQSDFYYPEADTEMKQTNGCTLARHERYKFLPNPIMGHLQKYHHVTLTSEYDFVGIPNSLPSLIKPGEKLKFKVALDRPELAESLKDCAIVAYVLDTETGEMLNATRQELSAEIKGDDPNGDDPNGKDPNGNSSVEEVAGSVLLSVYCSDDVITVKSSPEAVVDLFDIAGRNIAHFTLDANGIAKVNAPAADGVILVRVATAEGIRTLKIIL